MIKRELNIENLNLKYHIGIGRIKINYKNDLKFDNFNNDEKSSLDFFFSKLDLLEKKFMDSTIQIIKDEYLINEDHLFIACYHVIKAFIAKRNISNKKNLELLLYLSTNRQIKNGIKAFGIDSMELFENELIYCIMTPKTNLFQIKENLLKEINGMEVDSELNYQDIGKYKNIMKYFQINEYQIDVIMNSREDIQDKLLINLKSKFEVLNELICEKMALLSLEKIKID